MFGSKSVTLENPLFPGEAILVTVCAVSWVFLSEQAWHKRAHWRVNALLCVVWALPVLILRTQRAAAVLILQIWKLS